jgi:GNAT superfamily N-acetyltransferase
MFDGIGIPPGDADAAWRLAAEAWFRRHLAQPERSAAFVVDDPDLGPVSAACGICDDRPPGPLTLNTVRGYVFSVATDPRHRRRGYARVCLDALLSWFHSETDAEIIELRASPDGATLYEALGFGEIIDPTLRLMLAGDQTPGDPCQLGPLRPRR